MDNEIILKINGIKQRQVEIIFHKRISGNGEVLIQLGLDYKPSLMREFTAECLSITHKKWIASDGMCKYIVSLRNKVTGHYLPHY